MPHLLPGEELVSRRHSHWVVPFRALALPALLVLAVALADVKVHERLVPHDLKVIASLAAVAIFGLALIVTWLRWNSTSFTLTTQRVILETGIFSRSSKVIPVDRVQDVSTRRSLLGRVLGYGTVEIDAAGARGAEVLEYVPDADGLRDQVFVESDTLRRAPAAPDGSPAGPPTIGG